MKKSIGSKLFLVFFRNIRYKWLIALLVLLCTSFYSLYINYRFIDTTSKLQSGYNTYGNYQIYVSDVSYADVIKVQNIQGVRDTAFFITEMFADEYNGKTVFYSSDNILDMYHFTLVHGAFPTGKDDIICEEKYWKKYLDSKPLDECQVTIGDNTFNVCGLVSKKEIYQNLGNYVPDFILSIEAYDNEIQNDKNYSILIQTEIKDVKSFKNTIKSNLKLNNNQVTYNLEAVYFAGMDSNMDTVDPVFLVCDVLIYFIALGMAGLLSSLVALFLSKIKHNMAVCSALGVSKKIIVASLLASVSSLIIPPATMISLASLITTYNLSENSLDWVAVLSKNIVLYLLFVVTLILFSLAGFISKNNLSISERLTNKDNVRFNAYPRAKVKNTNISEYAYPFLKLAKVNVFRKKNKKIMSVIGLTMAIIITASFLYLIHYSSTAWGIFKYDYSVEYDSSMQRDTPSGSILGITEYDKMKNQDDFDYFPYFYHTTEMAVDKNIVSEDYQKYLISMDGTFFKEFDLAVNKTVNIPFVVIMVDETNIQKVYGLDSEIIPRDGECVLISKIKCVPNGYMYSGLKNGDVIRYDAKESDFQDIETWSLLKVTNTIDTIDFPLLDGFYSCIIMVNQTEFEKIQRYYTDYYPRGLYLALKNDISAVDEFMNECSFLIATDLREEKEYASVSKQISEIIIYSMSIMLVILILLSSVLDFLNKYSNNKKQLAILKALGVPYFKRMLFLSYEFFLTFPVTVLIGIPISLLCQYGVAFLLRQDLGYFRFEIIPYTYVIPICVVLISYLLMIPISVVKMKEINVTDSLQREL